VIVTFAVAVTGVVVIVNVAVVAFAGTVTLAGTEAPVLLPESVTRMPPTGAAPFKVTVPVAELPPVRLVGLTDTEANHGLMVKLAVLLTALYVAVTVTVVAFATALVVMVNVAELAFAGTVTLAGIVAAELLSDTATITPPVGAGPVNVTVPVVELPSNTVVGFKLTAERAGGLIVRVAVREAPLYVSVIVTVVVELTGVVVTVKVAEVEFAGIVRVAGVAAAELLSDSATWIPPAGAGPFRVTVPVEEVPPVTDVGDRVTDDGVGGLTVSVAEAVPK